MQAHQTCRESLYCSRTRASPRPLPTRASGIAVLATCRTPTTHVCPQIRSLRASLNSERRLGCQPVAASACEHPTPILGTATTPAEFALALYRFTRPHTMLGTFVSVTSISLLAIQTQGTAPWAAALAGYAYALSSALLMNICIVGMNQIADIQIDKVNKPYLPLASGEFSLETGVVLTVGTGLASLLLGSLAHSPALMITLLLSLGLGVVYSVDLPFFRWKRSPFLAASCIVAVRAMAVQLGFYFHMQAHLARSLPSIVTGGAAAAAAASSSALISIGGGMQVSPAILFTLCFMLLFSVVIALFKDIPDTRGDRLAGVNTLTVRWGVSRVFWTCIWILTLGYAGAITYSVLAAHFWAAAVPTTAPLLASAGAPPAMYAASLSIIGGSGGNLGLRVLACVAGHCVLAGLLWQRALKTDLTSNQDISACYMHVWKLFYSEYILIPLLL